MLVRSATTWTPVLTGPVARVTLTARSEVLPRGTLALGVALPIPDSGRVLTVINAEQVEVYGGANESDTVETTDLLPLDVPAPTVMLLVKVRSPATASPCPPPGPS